MLGGLGYSLSEMPVIKAYQNGNEVTTPEQTGSSSESTFWTTGAIIGVAVGGSVGLLLLIAALVFFIRYKKRTGSKSQTPLTVSSGGMVANVTLRDTHTKKGDPVKVVIGGYDTPTTPRNRTFNQILKTTNVLSYIDKEDTS